MWGSLATRRWLEALRAWRPPWSSSRCGGRPSTARGTEQPAEPFRIAGNPYNVGGSDVTSFLLIRPDGHVLIDGGHAETAPMIIASIAQLGFDIRDVKVIVNSAPHEDHAGGLAEWQKASGAELSAACRRRITIWAAAAWWLSTSTLRR